MTVMVGAPVISSFPLVRGGMVAETYSAFSAWDLTQSKRENLDSLRDSNSLGARSSAWLREIVRVLGKRFDPDGADRSLVVLAANGCDLEEWKPLLLWHITRNDFLIREFLQNWLFPKRQAGAYSVHIPEVLDFARTMQGSTANQAWTSTTLHRVASGLVKIAADFDLLQGSKVKEFQI